jgi:protein tyrosine/serine phosphatase
LAKNPKFVAAFGEEVEKRAMRMVSARPETMFAMLEMVNERWGSAEGYVRKECGLTEGEIEKVRRVLTEEPMIETPIRDLANNHS